MRDPDENGWLSSAQAWIERMADGGDFSRRHVLDPRMLERVRIQQPRRALDVGCGEGRFCRKLHDLGVATVGIDPIEDLVRAASRLHPSGDYRIAFAEDLPFDDASFDMVISYLTLIDIDDLDAATSEMARVLQPGGRILVANLSSFATSSAAFGKRHCRETGEALRPLGDYLKTGRTWFEWDGLRIRNWHRPLSTYMNAFLSAGLVLRHFKEPAPFRGPPERVRSYDRMPYLMMMEWEKTRAG
ncbi:MAG: class I SAM-dependent methyltransferase [Pseudomonadota bacterium]